jgi:prophage antirepressor-like protein
MALRNVEVTEKGLSSRYTPGGDQQVSVIYEAGMWRLIFRSRRPEARELTGRVAEILKEIRIKGGYISPTATATQLESLADRAERQMRVLRLAQGLVDSRWLETKVRHVVGRSLGEEPEVAIQDRPLTVDEYLDGHVPADVLRSKRVTFGKKLAAAYRVAYNREPGAAPRFIDGTTRMVKAYTEAHRPLFDGVFREMFA